VSPLLFELSDGAYIDLHVAACDTLENIPDDAVALTEYHRLLRRGGLAILTVPQSDDEYATYDHPSVQTDDDRARVFGQPDHG